MTIEDEVFVGHGVMFINDLDPHAAADGRLQTEADWRVEPTRVCRRASIGSGAVILGGVTIGDGALIGAGAVVTRNVAPGRWWPGSRHDCYIRVLQEESADDDDFDPYRGQLSDAGDGGRGERSPHPFPDLSAQYESIRDEVLEALREVAESSAYVLGPRVAEFEEAFAAYVGSRHCVGVNSGTSALHLALICAASSRGMRSSPCR